MTLHDRHQISAGDIDLRRCQYQFGVCKFSPTLKRVLYNPNVPNPNVPNPNIPNSNFTPCCIEGCGQSLPFIQRSPWGESLLTATQCFYDIAISARPLVNPNQSNSV